MIIISQYICQIIILYNLNLYSVICQLYLIKIGKKKKKPEAIREISTDVTL